MLCKLAGALSVLSSEVSVLMLGVITADRLISIVFTFNCRRLTLRGTYVICGVVWVCGTIIAVVPTNDIQYFYNADRRYGFYGISFFLPASLLILVLVTLPQTSVLYSKTGSVQYLIHIVIIIRFKSDVAYIGSYTIDRVIFVS